jgi:hypothetical protein
MLREDSKETTNARGSNCFTRGSWMEHVNAGKRPPVVGGRTKEKGKTTQKYCINKYGKTKTNW